MTVTASTQGSRYRWAPPGSIRFGFGSFSILVSVRHAIVFGAMVLAVVAAASVSLSRGVASVDPLDALWALTGNGDDRTLLIVNSIRLPRVLAGIYVGVALGMAGFLLQTIARNRLATPGIIGIDNGATAFAVASIVAVSASMMPSIAALSGASLTALVILLLSGGSGTQGYRFIVTGVGVGAVLAAVTGLMLSRAPIDQANSAYPWTVGTLNMRADLPIELLGYSLLLFVPAALYLTRDLGVARLSEPVARGLGTHVPRVRALAIAVSVGCTGLAVAVGGPLGIVALAAPEMARKLTGPRTVPVLCAGAAGALIVVVADLIGRTIAAPIELPVGLVTAVVGGPYLIWVIIRSPRLS